MNAKKDALVCLISDFWALKNFIYLFFPVLGLHRCSGFSLVVENGDHSLAVACELLLVVASLGEAWALGPMVSVVVAPQL